MMRVTNLHFMFVVNLGSACCDLRVYNKCKYITYMLESKIYNKISLLSVISTYYIIIVLSTFIRCRGHAFYTLLLYTIYTFKIYFGVVKLGEFVRRFLIGFILKHLNHCYIPLVVFDGILPESPME